MKHRSVRHFFLLFLALPLSLASTTAAQPIAQVTQGRLVGDVWAGLCQADAMPVRVAAEDRTVEVIFDKVCNHEGQLFSPDDIINAVIYNEGVAAAHGWEEGVAALKLSLRGYAQSNAVSALKVVVEGQKEGVKEWTPLVSAAYDLNPNDLSILLTEAYRYIRLRVTPMGAATGRWGIEVNTVTLGSMKTASGIFGGPIIGTYTLDAARGCSAESLPVRASGAGVVEVIYEGACDAGGTFLEPHPQAGWDEGVAAFRLSLAPRCAGHEALPLQAEVAVQLQKTSVRVPLVRIAVTPPCDGQTLSFNIGMPPTLQGGGSANPFNIGMPPTLKDNETLSFNIGMPPALVDSDIGPIFLRVYSTTKDPWGMEVGDLRVKE